MTGQMRDAQRYHRGQTGKAMKSMISACPHCQRRGNFRKLDVSGVGDFVWVCHYCKGDWTIGLRYHADNPPPERNHS